MTLLAMPERSNVPSDFLRSVHAEIMPPSLENRNFAGAVTGSTPSISWVMMKLSLLSENTTLVAEFIVAAGRQFDVRHIFDVQFAQAFIGRIADVADILVAGVAGGDPEMPARTFGTNGDAPGIDHLRLDSQVAAYILPYWRRNAFRRSGCADVSSADARAAMARRQQIQAIVNVVTLKPP